MTIKRNFQNELSETPGFTVKTCSKPPKGYPNLEMFLSKIEEELFKVIETRLNYSNLTKEEWQVIQYLADGRSIIIKKADKGFSMVIWDKADYLKEANK